MIRGEARHAFREPWDADARPVFSPNETLQLDVNQFGTRSPHRRNDSAPPDVTVHLPHECEPDPDLHPNPLDGGWMGQGPTRKVNRRELLALGALGTTAAGVMAHDGMLGAPGRIITNALPWADGLTDAPEPIEEGGWHYLNSGEVAFLTAAVDRLIPPDPTGPSASEAGVVVFLDRQLAGAYGNGAHFYLEGPWANGAETQGYQSRFTPAQFYRHAIAAIEQSVGRSDNGKAFKDLGADRQDALLKQMESGDLKLEGPITAKAFFTMFLQNVLEGYFSDPMYGGNKDGSAWKMIGFPGAHYDYSEWVTAYNQPVPVPMVSLLGRRAWDRS